MQKEQSGKSTWIIFSRKNDLEIGVWQRFFNLVFSTHPFTPLNPHLEGQIPVYIAICKSTSKNVRNKMGYYTITSC